MTVIVKPNGHLYCSLDATYWCEHIEFDVRNGYDANSIWSSHPNQLTVEVPVIPSANLWATCYLIPNPNPQLIQYKVKIETDPAVEAEFLGFLHPPEARLILRTMVIDWFVGTKEPFVKECKAAGHGYKSELRWQEDAKDRLAQISQKWSVFMTSKCLGCTYVPDDAFVPDPGKPASPFANNSQTNRYAPPDEFFPRTPTALEGEGLQ